jgi:hypothetical protein
MKRDEKGEKRGFSHLLPTTRKMGKFHDFYFGKRINKSGKK